MAEHPNSSQDLQGELCSLRKKEQNILYTSQPAPTAGSLSYCGDGFMKTSDAFLKMGKEKNPNSNGKKSHMWFLLFIFH